MKCKVLGGYMAEGNSIKDEIKEQRRSSQHLRLQAGCNIYGNITEFQLRRL